MAQIWRRLFGWDNDPNTATGGSNFEAVTPPIADPAKFWPAHAAHLEWNPTRVNRNAEVRGRRAISPEIPLSVRPVITATLPTYRSIAEKVLKCVMGLEGTITPAVSTTTSGATLANATVLPVTSAAGIVVGNQLVVDTGGNLDTVTVQAISGLNITVTAMTHAHASGVAVTGGPYTHPLTGLGYGTTMLPTLNAQIVRDALNHKATGMALESANFTFPLDGQGTIEVQGYALWAQQIASGTAIPTAVFTDLSPEPLYLRDCKVFFDGGTASPDINELTFGWTNNLATDNRHYAGRCIETKTIGTPALTRKLWYPFEHKLGGEQDVTWGLRWSNPEELQGLANQYGQIQKVVAEISGQPIPNNASNELLRFTLYASEIDGGGPDPLASRGDIPSSYTGRAFYSDADAKDVLVESVNGSAVAIP